VSNPSVSPTTATSRSSPVKDAVTVSLKVMNSAIAAAPQAARATVAAIPRLADSSTTLSAMILTKTAAATASSLLPTLSVAILSESAIPRKPVPAIHHTAPKIRRRMMAQAAAMALAVPPDSARVEICSARLSWVVTRRATTHTLAITAIACSAAQAQNLEQDVMDSSRTS